MKVWELYTTLGTEEVSEGLSREELIFKSDVFALWSLGIDQAVPMAGVIYFRSGWELLPLLYH